MGYKYQDVCYETQADALQAVADKCGIQFIGGGSSTNSGAFWCKVSGSSIQMTLVTPGSNTPVSFNYLYPVTLGSCTYTAPSSSTGKFTNQDVIDMSWLVVSVWVVAWGIRKMIEVIRR